MRKLLASFILLLLAPSLTFAAPTFQSSQKSTGSVSTVTYTAVGIGTASATRDVICLVVAESASLTSATIGGVTATIATTTGLNSGLHQSMIIANVPTGTTADIVLNFDGLTDSVGCGVYTDSDVNFTIYDSGRDQKSGSSPNPSTVVDIPASGFVLGWGYTNNDSATTYAWTNVTERYDESIRGNTRQSGGEATPAAQSNYSVSASLTGASVFVNLAAVSMQYNAVASGAITSFGDYSVNWY